MTDGRGAGAGRGSPAARHPGPAERPSGLPSGASDAPDAPGPPAGLPARAPGLPAGPPLRILHAPRNIAHQASDVAAGLRRLGHHVEVWETRPNAFGFPADRTIPDAADGRLAWALVRDAVDRFDVLHFHFGQTLVVAESTGFPPFWDLPVYRALGKRVFFTFHGTDVRIRRIHEQVNPWSHYRYADVPSDDARTEKSIEVFRAYADRMFAVSVNLLNFVPQAEYLPRVIDLARWPEQPPAQRERAVVVHVASRRATKGTAMILAALDGLAAEGVHFELRLLEGVPHDTVRAEIAAADVLVDNVIAGSYGVTAMEALACSRVAVANLSDDVRREHPDCPVVHVDPTTFAPTLRTLLADAGERRRRAAAGRAFVERVHGADVIAARLAVAYAAPPPPAPRRAMPDWMSYGKQRRIERLEEHVGRLEMELARAESREQALRRRLGMAPDRGAGGGPRAWARRLVPAPVRARLRSRLRRPEA